MTEPKSSWWSQNTWQGTNVCTGARRAQIGCEEKLYLRVDGALFARQSIQDWARQSHGRAELVLAALQLWAGGCSGWPLEVSSNQYPCDFLLFTLRKAIFSYGVLSSKSGAWPQVPVPSPAVLTPWTPKASVQEWMWMCSCCSQLMDHLQNAPNSTVWFHLGHCPVTPVWIPAVINTNEAPGIRFSICNVGRL